MELIEIVQKRGKFMNNKNNENNGLDINIHISQDALNNLNIDREDIEIFAKLLLKWANPSNNKQSNKSIKDSIKCHDHFSVKENSEKTNCNKDCSGEHLAKYMDRSDNTDNADMLSDRIDRILEKAERIKDRCAAELHSSDTDIQAETCPRKRHIHRLAYSNMMTSLRRIQESMRKFDIPVMKLNFELENGIPLQFIIQQTSILYITLNALGKSEKIKLTIDPDDMSDNAIQLIKPLLCEWNEDAKNEVISEYRRCMKEYYGILIAQV